ncbi:MaoC family dehydratase [Ferrimicrobium sp.]|uniref:MaoC family dehydratase n=1 Tax=Ferrimicrobium sp. TaxID=2926050 RepID=UPI00260D4329|nr:MaoC family dehydratase [Ferrimicrobium sp.]
MPTPVHGVDGLKQLVGVDLGFTPYRTVTQEQITMFADATDDHQWIHVDPEAAKTGPFGTTIAHGFLTLSLVSAMLPEILQVDGISMGVNYGTNRVRFPAPVPVNARIRLGAMIAEVTEVTGGVQVQVNVSIEVEGASKPSMVGEILFRYYH